MIVETRFRWAAYLAAIACAITRAPTLMQDGKVFELPLAINVGYVVLFGPLVILIFYVDAFRSVRLAKDIEDRGEDLVFQAILLAPAVLGGFLALQYFLEVRPAPGPCEPGEWRALFGWEEFQTTYCFGNVAQDSMPWVMRPPLAFSAAQIAMPLLSLVLAWLTITDVRKVR